MPLGQLAHGNLSIFYKWYQMSAMHSNPSSGSRPEFNSRESEWVSGGGGYHSSCEKSWKSFERWGHRSSRWCVLPGTLCLWTICIFSPIEVILTGLFHSSQLCSTWPLAGKWSGFHSLWILLLDWHVSLYRKHAHIFRCEHLIVWVCYEFALFQGAMLKEPGF